MKIKHTEIEINAENPFANCKLDREQYAYILSDIVNAYAEGFVLAINNEWGTGKTTFIKMWQQHLINNGFKTIYFNVWENDFDNNPLVPLMSELKALTNKKNDKIFKSVVEKGAVLAKNILPALVKSIANKHLDSETFIATIENVTKGTTEILEKEINEYTTKKKTVLEFKKELEKFIKETCIDKPLVFIVDELDRCRPNYAVEVLEQIKHFFSVSGIVFVLSIDKKHLASSIKGYYGSESINTDEYLRRFIDLEYSIPKPSTKQFCRYLFDYYSFNDFYSNDTRKKYSEFSEDDKLFLNIAELLFDKSNATLRQQEKIFALMRLILSSFSSTQYAFPYLLFVLVYIKTMKNQLYQEIRSNILDLQKLSDILEDLLPFNSKSNYGINLPYLKALLLHFYNNNQEFLNRKKLIDTDVDGKFVCFIKSKFEKESDSDNLANCLNHINKQPYFNDLKLNFLLNKIDLMDTVNQSNT